MKRINQIKIGGHLVEVRWEHDIPTMRDNMGEAWCSHNVIRLSTLYPQSQQEETFLHELIHHVLSNLGHKYGKDYPHCELLVEGISQALYQVLRDNEILFDGTIKGDEEHEKIDYYLHEKMGGLPEYDKAVKLIKAMVENAGVVNLDFSDVKSILDEAKVFSFYSGTESDIAKIRDEPEVDGVLLSIEGPETMSLNEARNIVDKISEKINKEARIVWGARINNRLEETKFFAILVQNKQTENDNIKDKNYPLIDIEQVCIGLSKDKKIKMTKFVKEFEKLGGSKGKIVSTSAIIGNLKNQGVTEEDIDWLVNILRMFGDVFEPKEGFMKRI